MALKSIIRIVLLIFVVGSVSLLIAREYGSDPSQEDRPAPSEAVADKAPVEARGDVVALYYFYGNRRCYTCRTIEAYLKETIETSFPEEIATGSLEWRSVNVEAPGNRHFIQDFRLASPGAVVAKMRGGAAENWKNLDLVWRLVRDKPAFVEYVRGAISPYLAKGGSDE